jgi:large subunit ribosomal protein L29
MATMKASVLREQTAEELALLAREHERQLVELKANKGLGDESEQPLKIRSVRRELARIRTVMRERELEQA